MWTNTLVNIQRYFAYMLIALGLAGHGLAMFFINLDSCFYT